MNVINTVKWLIEVAFTGIVGYVTLRHFIYLVGI